MRLPVERAADADEVRALLPHVGGGRIVEREQGVCGAVLLDDGVQREQLRAWSFDRSLEGSAASDESGGTNYLDDRSLGAAQREEQAPACPRDRHQQEGKQDDDRATHGSMI